MGLSRRGVIVIGGTACIGFGGFSLWRYLKGQTPLPDHYLYPYVKATQYWGSQEFDEFLRHLKVPEQDLVLKALGKSEGTIYNPDQVKKDIKWLASNIAEYPFVEKLKYDYHEEIVKWLANSFNADENKLNASSTFYLERMILNAVFSEIWDKLTRDQRLEILKKVDTTGKIKDKAGIALAGGAVALGLLSSTVYFAGATFYLTMSTVIYTTAGFLGVTLPFSAYMASSSTVAFLSGPVGWAIFSLTAVAATLFLGRADKVKTAAFVIQLHLIKVNALEQSGKLSHILKQLQLN